MRYLLVAVLLLCLGCMAQATTYTWDFSNESDYWLQNATWYLGGATVPPRVDDQASVFAWLNTQAPGLSLGDIRGGGYTVTGLTPDEPGRIYGSLYLSPTGGAGSTVLILLSPMAWAGSAGNYTYTFGLNTHADYRTRIPPGDWSVYDPARSGTFAQVAAMIDSAPYGAAYAAFFGPQIGMSGTSGTTFHVTQLQLKTKPPHLAWQTRPIAGDMASDITGDLVLVTGPTPIDPSTGLPYRDLDNKVVLGPTIPHYSIVGDPLFGIGWPSKTGFVYDSSDQMHFGSGVFLAAGHTYDLHPYWTRNGVIPDGYDLGSSDQDGNYGFLMAWSYLYGMLVSEAGTWTYVENWTDEATGEYLHYVAPFSLVPGSTNPMVLNVPPDSLYVRTGDTVTVYLNQGNLDTAAAGYQAFVAFDGKLIFDSGAYTDKPYGLPLRDPIVESPAGMIKVSAGILSPDLPTKAEARLASLTFTAGAAGTTQVRLTAFNSIPSRFTDASGYEIATQTVDGPPIIIDNTAPDITCAGPIAKANDSGVCGATVTIAAATATDTGGSGVESVIGTRNDGLDLTAVYPVGVTTITWTATDLAGNVSTCDQTVTVTDNEPPTCTCPANIGPVDNTPGLCSAVVSIPPCTVNDNCPGATCACTRSDSLPLTDPYPVGVTTITCTATDAAANVSVPCSFTVTVVDSEKPAIACPADLNVNNDPGVCSWTPAKVNEAFDSDPDLLVWTVDRYAPAAFNSVTFDGDKRLHIGIAASDWQSNAFYNTQGRERAFSPPDVSKISGELYIPSSWENSQRRSDIWGVARDAWNNISGYPIIGFANVDGSSPVLRVFTQDTDQDPSNGYQAGWRNLPNTITYDKWYKLDIELAGNQFRFSVDDVPALIDSATFGSLSFSAMIVEGFNFQQNYDIYWDNIQAGPLMAIPAVDDNCDIAGMTAIRSDAPLGLGDPYPVGSTTITWTVTDIHSNTKSCDQKVTVADNEKPVLTKGSIAAYYPSVGDAQAAAIAATTATDNCGTPVKSASTAGTCTAVVTVRATDGSFNYAEVTYNTQIDGTKPTVTSATASPRYVRNTPDVAITAAGTDNCTPSGSLTWEQQVDSGVWKPGLLVANADLTEGSHTLHVRATDAAGNVSDAFTVTPAVCKDTQPPIFVSASVNDPACVTDQDVYYGYSVSDPGCSRADGSTIQHRVGLSGTWLSAPYMAVGNAELSDGPNTIYLRIADNAGNMSDAFQVTTTVWKNWTYPTITSIAASQGGASVLCGDGVAVQGVAVDIYVDGADPLCGATSYPRRPNIRVEKPAVTVDGIAPVTYVGVVGTVYHYTVTVLPTTTNGPHTINVTARDALGHPTVNSTKSICVNKWQAVVTIDLQSVYQTVTRTIRFGIGGAGGPAGPVFIDKAVLFDTALPGIGRRGTVALTNLSNDGQWTCITAKDEQHTLRQKVALTVGGDNQYSASFTGVDALVGGDATNDNLIDILDFGVFAGQYNQAARDYPARDADFDCSGWVGPGSADFSFISTGYLQWGDDPCLGALAAGVAPRPRTSISLEELASIISMPAARKADLNRDRVIDMKDVELFAQQFGKR